MTERKLTLDEANSLLSDITIHTTRLTRQNVTDLKDWFIAKFTTIPCHQSVTGHAGALLTPAEHLLHNSVPFAIPTHPGPLILDPNVGRAEQANLERQHQLLVDRYDTYTNLNQAARAALERSIPRQYRPERVMGNSQASWPPEWGAAQILKALCKRYSKLSYKEREDNQNVFQSPFDPSQPIEELIDRIETCQRIAIDAAIEWTTPQLIHQLVSRLVPHQIYAEPIRRWAELDETDRSTWQQAKEHFISEYETHLDHVETSITSGAHGYAHHAEGTDDDNVSLADTVEELGTAFNVFGQTYNSNINGLNDNLSTISNATQTNTQSIQQITQQLALLATQLQQGHPAPNAYASPAPPTYVAPPQYVAPPAMGRGSGYQSRGGRRRTSQRTGQRPQQASHQGAINQYQPTPATAPAGAIQPYRPPTGQQQQRGNRGFQSNPVKHHNNWWACYSCGFDVDHQSHQCNNRKPNHQNNFSRTNYQEYERMGWPFCRKGMHKNQLPSL